MGEAPFEGSEGSFIYVVVNMNCESLLVVGEKIPLSPDASRKMQLSVDHTPYLIFWALST